MAGAWCFLSFLDHLVDHAVATVLSWGKSRLLVLSVHETILMVVSRCRNLVCRLVCIQEWGSLQIVFTDRIVASTRRSFPRLVVTYVLVKAWPIQRLVNAVIRERYLVSILFFIRAAWLVFPLDEVVTDFCVRVWGREFLFILYFSDFVRHRLSLCFIDFALVFFVN